jgi:hypothetical protein
MTWISSFLNDKTLRWCLRAFLAARVALTARSLLIAFALDCAIGGFGGGYTLIPLTALFWQSRAPSRI